LILSINEKGRRIDRMIRGKKEYREIPCDYLCGRIGIERKTVDDFVRSIIDGRLDRQVAECINNNLLPVVIVEGRWNILGNDLSTPTRRHYGLGKSFITKLAKLVLGGAQVIWSPRPEETATIISAIERLGERTGWGEEIDLSHYTETRRKRPGSRATKIRILTSIRGIGEHRARKALEHANWSIRRIQEMTERELAKAVGPESAKRIKEALR